MAVLLLLYAVPASLGEFTYRRTSYCGVCGRMMKSKQLQLPYLHQVNLWQREREEDTAVGRVLREQGIVGPHAHRWVGARGRGNGIG